MQIILAGASGFLVKDAPPGFAIYSGDDPTAVGTSQFADAIRHLFDYHFAENRPVTPEEYTMIAQFVDRVERRTIQIADILAEQDSVLYRWPERLSDAVREVGPSTPITKRGLAGSRASASSQALRASAAPSRLSSRTRCCRR